MSFGSRKGSKRRIVSFLNFITKLVIILAFIEKLDFKNQAFYKRNFDIHLCKTTFENRWFSHL